MNDYYVYMYLREFESDIAGVGTPYYIGKGRGKRHIDKRHRINLPCDRSNIVFHTKNLSEAEAFSLEMELIEHYGRIDIGTGILRNMTSGGDGNSGRIFTDAHKRKLSESKSGENSPRGMLGKKHSQETLDKMSEKQSGENNPMYGREHTAEDRKKMSEAKKGKSYGPMSEDHRAAISRSKSGENHPMWGKKQKLLKCPHCGKEGGDRPMKRWHFDNCKEKIC